MDSPISKKDFTEPNGPETMDLSITGVQNIIKSAITGVTTEVHTWAEFFGYIDPQDRKQTPVRDPEP